MPPKKALKLTMQSQHFSKSAKYTLFCTLHANLRPEAYFITFGQIKVHFAQQNAL